MENFKPILEYNGIYEVSNKGTIRTDKDKTTYLGKLAHDIELGKLSDTKWRTGKETKNEL